MEELGVVAIILALWGFGWSLKATAAEMIGKYFELRDPPVKRTVDRDRQMYHGAVGQFNHRDWEVRGWCIGRVHGDWGKREWR